MIDRLAWTLLHSLWQGIAVAALLAIALGYAYRAPARVRYALGCLALAALVVLPIGTFLALGGGTPSASGVVVVATPSDAVGSVVAASPRPARFDPLASMVAFWSVGVALLTLRLVGSIVQVERWRRRHTRPDEALARQVAALATRLGIAGPVRALVADGAAVPCAWGVLRPVIAVPASLLTGLPPLGLEAILLHELAHIRRHDYLVNVLQSVAETLLFFHPATWWISSLVRREREHCCDDVVVAALGDPLPYARALLRLEERRHALPSPALSARGGTLMNRIQRLTGRASAPSRLLPTLSTVATVGLVAAFVGGALQAQAGDKRPQAARPAVVKDQPAKTGSAAKRTGAKTTPAATRAAGAKTSTVAIAGRGTTQVAPTKVVIKPATATVTVRGGKITATKATAKVVGAPTRWSIAVEAAPPQGGVAVARGAVADPMDAAKGQAVTEVRDAASGQAVTEAVAAATTPARLNATAAMNPPDLKIVSPRADRFNVRAKFVPLTDVLTDLAEASGESVIIEAKYYSVVTAVLSDQTFASAIELLCRSGNATCRMESGVYIVTILPPKD